MLNVSTKNKVIIFIISIICIILIILLSNILIRKYNVPNKNQNLLQNIETEELIENPITSEEWKIENNI